VLEEAKAKVTLFLLLAWYLRPISLRASVRLAAAETRILSAQAAGGEVTRKIKTIKQNRRSHFFDIIISPILMWLDGYRATSQAMTRNELCHSQMFGLSSTLSFEAVLDTNKKNVLREKQG
jgi:hypothetical protein